MNRKNGFTLVELLVAIVVVTVLLAMSVPAFQEFIKNNRITSQANRLILAVQLARSEAVKRGMAAVVCSANAALDDCSTDNDWSNGWIVFTDPDSNSDLDSGGAILEVEECTTPDDFDTKDCILSKQEALTKSSLNADNDYLYFLPTGLAANGLAFTLKADDCYHQQQRSITVTPQGHPVVTKQNCS
jgi:type IV fimbrial biogenesis protein FimT